MAKAVSIEAGEVRPTAVAGQFYPRDATELRKLVESLLKFAREDNVVPPKAIIAPHAGYSFSGPIAASAYARFARERKVIKRVVLIGPSHFAAFSGLAASSAGAFATPLGNVAVDTEAVRGACRLKQVAIRDHAHQREHALEVQLPFLQVVLDDFKIVPLVVGEASDEEVDGVMEALWGGEETRFVISSDLSHYHDFVTAREMDSMTSRAIERLQPGGIDEAQACGCTVVRGLLRAAREHGLKGRTIDLRNSGDTAGRRDRVVGYGAFAFEF
jgi:hypothetical protein